METEQEAHRHDALAEDSPAMLWRGNVQGRCVYLNAAMRAFWGLTRDQCSQFDWSTSLLEEDRDLVFGPFGQGMTEQTPFTCEGRYRRHDGEIRVLRTKAKPVFSSSGAFEGMIGVNEDLTELRAAERELQRTNIVLAEALSHHQRLNDRLNLATRISGLAMSEHDQNLRYTWAHNISPDAIGRTPSELVGGGRVGASLHAILERTLASGIPQSEELPLEVNGVTRWFDIQTARISHADGGGGVIASALDVTTRKLNEQKLEVLARELSHRVKNVFAVVQAIVRQSARLTAVPDGFVTTIEERLQSLAAAQDALLRSGDNQVPMRDFLVGQLQHVSGVTLEGEDVHIPGSVAPYLALAIHELSTNALKYGALGIEGGRTLLSWSMTSDQRVDLVWEENGTAPFKPGRAGFGTTLLTRIFSTATGGETTLTPLASGLRWRAQFSVKPTLELGNAT